MGERGHPGPPGPPGEQGLPGLAGKEGTKVSYSDLPRQGRLFLRHHFGSRSVFCSLMNAYFLKQTLLLPAPALALNLASLLPDLRGG